MSRSLVVALTWALRARRRLGRDERGQAVVESAIVIPLMTFLILGMIQLVMIQHARIMTEYAAFNAARAGIVWNADRIIMESAAIISLLPTYEGLFKQSDLGNPLQMLKRIAQRALLYQVNRRLPQAIDLLKNGAGQIIEKIPIGSTGQQQLNDQKDALLDKAQDLADTVLQQAITGALGGGDDRLVTITVINPSQGTFGQKGREYFDFDDPNAREQTRLTIEVRYLYMMRVPFANWIIHQAWLAGMAGKQLYGAIWNPQEAPGETGFRSIAPPTPNAYSDPLLSKLDALAQKGVYMVPLRATYTMRMQSNPYKQSLQVK
jgi:hypothetical protein